MAKNNHMKSSNNKSNNKNYTNYKNSNIQKINNNYSKNSNKTKAKNSNIKPNFENTTRIRIDSERLDDFESLDISFIDKKTKNVEKTRKNLLKDKKSSFIPSEKIKKSFSLILIFLLVLVVFFILMNSRFFVKTNSTSKETVEKMEEVGVIDDNYLFVGDFHTKNFDFSNFEMDYHYVNVGLDDITTEYILNHMKEMIYNYNPSIVLLEVGINDLREGISSEEILDQYCEIINLIKVNRPYSKIIIESLYPVNSNLEEYDSEFIDSVSEEDIKEFNRELKELAKKEDVNYLDVYTELSEDGSLKESYTDNGIDLNRDGYSRIFKTIRKIVDDEK